MLGYNSGRGFLPHLTNKYVITHQLFHESFYRRIRLNDQYPEKVEYNEVVNEAKVTRLNISNLNRWRYFDHYDQIYFKEDLICPMTC